MQPVPPPHESPSSEKPFPTRPRTRKSDKQVLVEILSNVRFWAGLSILLVLVSLALPWWGVTVGPSSQSASWGLFFGLQSQPTNALFSPDSLDSSLAANYTLMTTLVLVTGLATLIGAILKKGFLLGVSFTLSLITVLAFFDDVGGALSHCTVPNGLVGYSCISGLAGQGVSGTNLVTWGFQLGFYTFIASMLLVLVGIRILQRSKSGYNWPLSGID